MDNHPLKIHNIQIYGNICMCGYKLTKNNPLTMHHIVPKSEGGKTNYENSSNVSNLAHTGLHIVSNDDLHKAKQIKEYLLYFKQYPDIVASLEFKIWLQHEVLELDFIEIMSRDRLLIYKRRK